MIGSLPALVLTLLASAPPERPPGEKAPLVPPTLAAPLELPAAFAARRDLAPTVQVQLTVQVDGTPKDLTVVKSPGEPYSSIALQALSRARFTPATQDGVPIAVRIVAPITIGLPTPWLRLDRRDAEPSPTIPAGIDGVVLERGTRRPVAGVAVFAQRASAAGVPVEGSGLEAMTDEEGRFAFRDLAAGRWQIDIPLFGDEGTKKNVAVPSSLTLRVTPDATREYRTRVSGDGGSTTNAARVRVPMERAREVPGSNGDPLKVLESLPGVARPSAAGPGAGQITVRGSAPEDTQYYVDGLPLFQLYHFGNIYSVLQDEWIGDIDFRAGGYSTEYGDATGGLIDVTLKDLAKDGIHGHVDLNVYHGAVLLTAPISEHWTIGAALRRSWVDVILGSIIGDDAGFSFSTAPRYYDYQVRADYVPSDKVKLRLLTFGSDDELVILGDSPNADDPDGSDFAFSRGFHQVQGTLEVALASDLALRIGTATSYQTLRVKPADNDFELTFDPLTIRADLDWRASPKLRLRGGLLGDVTRFKIDLSLPRPSKEGEVQLPTEVQEVITASEDGFSGRIDGWGEASLELTPELTTVGGLRLASWYGNFDNVALDARLAFGWKASDDTRVTVTGGVVNQEPAPDESSKTFGSTTLDPERSIYLNLGVVQRFGDLVSVELQGFYKALDQLVVTTGSFVGAPYDNAGTGTIYGGELLVRLTHPVVDGWLAYTLSRSMRTDRPGEPERYFSFDQTHVLSLVAGVQLGRNWRIGARVRYATGNPFTPLEPAYYDAGADVWVPRAAAAALSQRSEGFFQLDLRVDKTWIFDTWKLNLYLELNNATNRANIESIQYSEDYQSRDDITSLPLTPSLGIRASF